MLNLTSLENLPLIIICVVPGLIITGIRSRFLTGRIASHSTTLSLYVATSLLYNTFAYPFSRHFIQDFSFLYGWLDMLIWFLVVLFIPAIIGLLSGVEAQREWTYKCLRKWNLSPIHPLETAWDYKFKNAGKEWVTVTLKDGTYFGGYILEKSFASSNPGERDLYIAKIYDIDKEGHWELRERTSILVASGEIS